MKNFYTYIGAAILIIVVAGLIFIVTSSGTKQNNTTNTNGAPATSTARALPTDIKLKDYGNNEVLLADYIGKPLVINSWAVWCPFCVEELKEFAQVQKELGDDVVIIAIDRAESLNRVKSFTDDLGVTDDIIFLLDSRDSFYKKIGGISMPETVFVNSEGNIIIHKRGPMKAEEIKQKIQSIL